MNASIDFTVELNSDSYSLMFVAGADEIPGPVKWTRPYFDCGRANKWLVAAVVPIADIYPRHTSFRHIEYPTYVLSKLLSMSSVLFIHVYIVNSFYLLILSLAIYYY